MSIASPTVSVCIPTYQGAAHLGHAIDSVLGQSLTDFELIVVDDQSPDDTAGILSRYQDPRLVYVRNAVNLGPEGNWNRCLELAKGRYFKLLPHDDLLHPLCLERQVAILEADLDEEIALVFSARSILDPQGRLLARRGYPRGKEGSIKAQEVVRACIRQGTNLLGEPGAVLMRLSLARRVGSFNASLPYVIDLDYWFRLLAYGDAWYCPEFLAMFRISRRQWSFVIGRSQHQDFMSFVRRLSGQAAYVPGWLDILSARIMTRVNNALRLVFYKLYLGSG